ncbi:MAG: DivIVA domain-containing protein [Actinobacteria bacterium]|nr:DivIVA domain-containing protein [Actinomycetota bacterium]
MSLSLDDLRHPELRSRMLGYDRDEVDRLLAMVVVAVERLERRRQRDVSALEELSKEVALMQGRAEEAERRVAELSTELEEARLAESAATERAREWELRATEAAERTERAERALATGRAAAGPDDEELHLRLPVAQRAARAVLRQARAQAADIVRQAEERAAVGGCAGSEDADGVADPSGPTSQDSSSTLAERESGRRPSGAGEHQVL